MAVAASPNQVIQNAHPIALPSLLNNPSLHTSALCLCPEIRATAQSLGRMSRSPKMSKKISTHKLTRQLHRLCPDMLTTGSRSADEPATHRTSPAPSSATWLARGTSPARRRWRRESGRSAGGTSSPFASPTNSAREQARGEHSRGGVVRPRSACEQAASEARPNERGGRWGGDLYLVPLDHVGLALHRSVEDGTLLV